jgi:hypothetical protein
MTSISNYNWIRHLKTLKHQSDLSSSKTYHIQDNTMHSNILIEQSDKLLKNHRMTKTQDKYQFE